METNSEQLNASWKLCGTNFPRSEIVFLTQMLLIYTVVITALVNLTLGSKQHELWIILLSSCLGYVLPNPSIKKKHYSTTTGQTQTLN